jgi:outer membrane protein assembly factor BamB
MAKVPAAESVPPVAVTKAPEAVRPTKPACVDLPRGRLASAARDRGLDALAVGDWHAAMSFFANAMHAHPDDLASEMLSRAALKEITTAWAAAMSPSLITGRVQLSLPPRPTVAPAQGNGSPPSLALESEARDASEDESAWIARHGLVVPIVPSLRPTTKGHISFYQPGFTLSSYAKSRLLVGWDDGARARTWGMPQALPACGIPTYVTFARLVDSVLLVQFGSEDRAKPSPLDGQLAAYNADSGQLLWATTVGISNAENFVLSGDSVITGYAVSGQAGALYVTDLKSGTIKEKVSLASAPTLMAWDDGRLFVRTREVDYVFRSTTVAASPPAPKDVCWLRATAGAIDGRDLAALRTALDGLPPLKLRGVLRPVVEGLSTVLDASRNRGWTFDLWGVVPTSLPEPPWTSEHVAAAAPTTPPTLARLIREKREMAEHREIDANVDVPRSYGMGELTMTNRDGERDLLVYGGRYVIVTRQRVAERVLDLDAFRRPPKLEARWRDVGIEPVTHAELKEQTLYVCNGDGAPAKGVHGKKGFLSAIDVPSGKLLWRSDAQICSHTFVSSGDYLISGYGFGGELSTLFVVRSSDGKVVARASLDGPPESIERKEGRIMVNTPSFHYEFISR